MQQESHITISKLTMILEVSRPTITRTIKNLQNNGVIERIVSKELVLRKSIKINIVKSFLNIIKEKIVIVLIA